MRAAVYTRISNDPTRTGLGVQRQAEDCQTLVSSRGWTSVGLYQDNDLSAYSGKPRPAYQRLCDDIRAGQVDAVVAWADDRLHRHPRELEDWIDLIEEHRVEIATVTSGAYDLGTPEGRAMARIVGAMARQESERKSVRSRRKHRQLAESGKDAGGGTRPFGFLDDRVSHHPVEAPLIREAADRLLAGETLRGVIADWTDRGIETVTGRPWQLQTFRTIMRSGRIAGLREYKGEVVGKAEWDPIISETEHRQIRAKFSGRSGSRPRVNPLVGLVECGRCGSQLIAGRTASGKRQYRCPTDPPGVACGKVSSLADPLEKHVLDRIVDVLDGGGLDRVLTELATSRPDRDELAQQLAADEQALQQLARDHYSDRLISRGEFLAARASIEDRLAATRLELAAATSAQVLVSVEPSEGPLRKAWEHGTVAWRQSLASSLIAKVALAPAVRGRNFFDPGRVTIEWVV